MAIYGRRPASRVARFSSIQQILIVNAGLIGGDPADLPADPTELDEGELAFFDDEGNAIDLSATTITDFDRLIAVLGLGGGEYARTSILANRFDQISKTAYQAPTAQVSTLTVPDNPADNEEEITLKVTNLENGFQPHDRINASLYVTGGETGADLAQAFADLINANKSSTVTASTSGADLTLTADEAGEIFTVGLSGSFLEGTTVTQSTDPSVGNGSWQDVRVAEKATAGTLGRYNQEDGLMGSVDFPTSLVSQGGEYDLYNLLHKNDQDDAINRSFKYQQVVIAAESDADTTNLDSFLGIA